jgi:hypothetical protein
MRPFARTMPEVLTSARPSFTYGGDRITSGQCRYSKMRRAQANHPTATFASAPQKVTWNLGNRRKGSKFGRRRAQHQFAEGDHWKRNANTHARGEASAERRFAPIYLFSASAIARYAGLD